MSASGERTGTQHVTGLDGIRAFAVLAVMGVHQEFGWLPGGFYGVDAFFVLSGFLITALLVRELAGTGTVRLGAFWARRARRLLPALVLLVVVVGVAAAVDPSLLGVPSLPGLAATLFYSANWYFVGQHVNYFAVFSAPSPLLHTWSLAIEEQFYLVWPLVVLAVLAAGRGWRRGRRRDPRRGGREDHRAPLADPLSPGDPLAPAGGLRRRVRWLLAVTVAGAGLSALWMAHLAPGGGAPGGADPARAYYGTDCRAQAILVGAALALLLALRGRPAGRRTRRVVGGVAVAGAAGTVALWRLVPETSWLAFHGGFLLAALAAAAVVAQVAVAPAGLVSRVLSLRPLAALGRISYGVYLWYWPVTLAVSEDRTHLEAYALFAVRLAVTVGIATLSYLVVEQPIRQRRVSWKVPAVAAPAGLAAAMLATAVAVPAAATVPVPSARVLSAADHPTKVLLVGDSAAGSLGVGLGQLASRYGIQLMNDGDPGCSLSVDQMMKTLWYTLPPGRPCREGDPAALLARWRHVVDRYNPDVVVYLGRSDLLDQQVDGRWEHIGQAGFDRYLAGRLRQGIGVLGARGATVVLLTSPYYDTEDTPHPPWPEDQPVRVREDNALLRQVAAEADRATVARAATGPAAAAVASSGSGRQDPKVTVFDLGGLVTPGGHFTSVLGGTTLRCADGVHFTAAGGAFVARKLLPVLVAAGRAHHREHPGGRWPGTPPPTTPAWWDRLPCG
ncbi:MAG TPA: acyltransferase family protein [Acidimicrobiales bacterium]|nr:acyltransferase family protein [Acidimicrobiales bacterium]